MWYLLPIPCFAFLLALSLAKNRQELFCPQNMLCGIYFAISFGAILVDSDDLTNAYDEGFIRNSVVAFILLLMVSLLPCILIRRPDTSALYEYAERAKPALFVLAILGIYGFLFFLPYSVNSFFVDAYVLRELKQVAIFEASPALTIAFIPSTFFALYGLLLLSPLASRTGWFIKTGLTGGFATYALSTLGHKGRDFVVQYLLLAVFYYWLYGSTWSKKLKRTLFASGLVVTLLGFGVFIETTIERFGEQGTRLGYAAGTVGYMGQQVYIFVETVAEEDFASALPSVMFPLYYSAVGREMENTEAYLGSRTLRHQWSFGTFLASFFPIGGWLGLTTFVVMFALLFVWAFRVLLATRKVLSYTLLLLLYYHFMFQGAFYWFMFGRAWNVYVCLMVLGVIMVALTFDTPSGRRRRESKPLVADASTQGAAWRKES